jgi:hypothetical protein
MYFLVRRYTLIEPPRPDRDRIACRTVNRVIWLDKGRLRADSVGVHTMMLG